MDSEEKSQMAVPAVSVNDVSKKFCRSLKRSLAYGVLDTFCDLMGRSLEEVGLRKDEFWANQHVSLDVNRGECVGLIGHNGAGKTTVLKMLNGLIKPDGGVIKLRGRVGALIALGAGFNPVLTGRENVFINGAVLGLERHEIQQQLDEIIEFAEIGEFIDAPVRSYSSGMQVRLGFAVATALKPDILLIDEVLAVGDVDFRMKCVSRIAELLNADTAVVLVSHSMTDIQRVCTRTIVMDHGEIAFDGDVSAGIARYEAIGTMRKLTNQRISDREIAIESVIPIVNGIPCADPTVIHAQTGDELEFAITLLCLREEKNVRFRLFLDSEKLAMSHVCSLSTSQCLPNLTFSPGKHVLRLRIGRIPLRLGAFSFGISAHRRERDIVLPNTFLGILHIDGPPIELAAKADAGFVEVSSEWTLDLS